MISITQEPYGLQPVNSDHIWTIYDTEYTGYTNYKYVVDFYIDPFEEGHEKIGRIKLRPNSSGRASFDAQDIIGNYIQPNPRVPGSLQYFTIENGTGFTFTNYLNDNTDFEKLRHIANYRILIGKEYTSGGSITIDIPTDYYTPTYSISVARIGGTDTMTWTRANDWQNYVSSWALANQTWDSGFTWTHTTSGGSFIDGGSGLGDTGSYTPLSTPSVGDIFWIYSNQNGCGVWYEYQYEGISWDLRGDYDRYNAFDGCDEDHSDFKTIWLGAAPNLLTQPTAGTLVVNSEWALRYKMIRGVSGNSPDLSPYQNAYENRDWDIEQGAFLNTFGGKAKGYNISNMDFTTDTTGYIYSRKHHRDCPIILNWMSGKNGAYSSTADFLITFSGTGNQITSADQLTPLSDGTGLYTPTNELIQSYIVKDIPTNTDWQGFMLSDGTPPLDAWSDGNSMLLLYELYGDECIEDPVHFLFINRHGGFDTYTFGQKNIRSHSTSISTYAKNGITDKPLQKWGSEMYRNTPYDQTTITSVETQSTFVDENDVPIIQDLFLSPYVWRIQPFKSSTYLVPIQITSNSVEEYKSRYNKLYQYDMTFEYNPIRQFNNPI